MRYGNESGVSTGAGGDLANATRIAERMICEYGMDNEFGLACIDRQALSGSVLADAVRTKVNELLKECMEDAVRMITENKDRLDKLVSVLMEKNHMTGEEIKQTLGIN